MQLLEFVFWIFLIWGVVMAITGLYMRYSKDEPDSLDALYAEIWTGSEADRVYAWDRVMYYLYEYKPNRRDLMHEARRRKQLLHRSISETMAVDEYGRLIKEKEEI